MKKRYTAPTTTVIDVKMGILCASGARLAPKGNLQSIGKCTGEW